jgi:hypothetical protein
MPRLAHLRILLVILLAVSNAAMQWDPSPSVTLSQHLSPSSLSIFFVGNVSLSTIEPSDLSDDEWDRIGQSGFTNTSSVFIYPAGFSLTIRQPTLAFHSAGKITVLRI